MVTFKFDSTNNYKMFVEFCGSCKLHCFFVVLGEASHSLKFLSGLKSK